MLRKGSSDTEERMQNYSAKLLFQFRVESNGESDTMRTCEVRFISFNAASATAAMRFANRCGRRSELKYPNSYGGIIHIEFVGIMDMLQRGSECDDTDCEVFWYDITVLKTPMERKAKLIPEKAELLQKLSR
jgi:Domain of unknown function (DUF4288)